MSCDITAELLVVHEKDPQSAEKLLPLLYEELRRIAGRKLGRQPAGQTIQATALVHEAVLRLIGDPARTWENRRHFIATATAAMRHILVDRARSKATRRHGGDLRRLNLDDVNVAAESADESILLLNEALDGLEQVDAAAAELVRLRFFGGFTFTQAAEVLGTSERTAKRLWAYARAWLFERIRAAHGGTA